MLLARFITACLRRCHSLGLSLRTIQPPLPPGEGRGEGVAAFIYCLFHGLVAHRPSAASVAAATSATLSHGERGYSRATAVDDRLAQLAADLTHGRRAYAELEFFSWLREPDCPIQARILLAAAWSVRDQHEKARALLADLPRAQVDQLIQSSLHYAQLLLTLQTACDLTQAARRTLTQLDRAHGHDPQVRHWISAIDAPGRHDLPRWSPACVEQLAGDLLGRVYLLPALVSAQKVAPDIDHIHLLRLAGQRLLRDVTSPRQQLTLAQAMAELAILTGDADDARRWAHRGLRIDPYCATLALVLAQVRDEAVVGPPAIAILTEVAEHHPQYPDVQAALIRRELQEGHTDTARLRLQSWMQREPHQPLALKLAQELAA